MARFTLSPRHMLAAAALSWVAVGAFAAEQQNEKPAGYGLQPGDVIEVSVWKEQDLQRELLVSPDGFISFPLIGHIKATGHNVRSLNAAIAKRLSNYIPDPSVTVMLKQAAGSQFYVMGKVNRPGAYPLNSSVSVLQALSVAGGVNVYAKSKSIKIIREGATSAFTFNLNDVDRGKNLQQNIALESGDVVVVP